MYITGQSDVDQYMVQYLDITSLQNLMMLSQTLNQNLGQLVLMQQLKEFIGECKKKQINIYGQCWIIEWACGNIGMERKEWISFQIL